jgi:phosphatidylethanolamine/phosphatidyl-N-methylethanolamine N-methyltransferase
MANTLESYLHFIWAALVNQAQMGAIVPSQRFLIEKMIAPIPKDYRGQIVELGAGSGALTLRLAARCPQARIMACEINPALARDLEQSVVKAGLNGRVMVISDSAEHLLSEIDRRDSKKPDYVISGIPLGNLPKKQVVPLVEAISRTLADGGMYIQFQHSLIDRKKIQARLPKMRTVPAFLNFPPAFVYYARK